MRVCADRRRGMWCVGSGGRSGPIATILSRSAWVGGTRCRGGRRLRGEPERLVDVERYGIDRADRIVWVRKWSVRPPGSVQIADELLEETDLGLVCAAFGPVMEGERPWLHRLDRWVFDEGRVTLHESAVVDAFATGMQLGHADYAYDKHGRVATVEAWEWDPDDPDADRAGVSRRWSVRPVYGAEGEMVEVREGPNVTWVRPRRGVSVRSLSQREDRGSPGGGGPPPAGGRAAAGPAVLPHALLIRLQRP